MQRDLTKAISVGPYPAPCFPSEKQHRRFLWRLASQGTIRLLDSEGNTVTNKASHYDCWHVDEHDAQVIEKQIQEEIARLESEKKRIESERKKREEEWVAQAQEQRIKEVTQHQEEKKKNAEERKKRNADLKSRGQWSHPLYKTLKAARADGWHKPQDDEYDGEEISLKGHTLVRKTKRAQSRTWWNERGFEVKANEIPHGARSFHPGRFVVYDVYREDQVTAIVPTEPTRLCLHCQSRLPLDRFIENERVCLSCWGKEEDRREQEKVEKQTKKLVERDKKDYLKKTGFLPH